MKLRMWKIGLLAGPLLLLSGSIVLLAYANAMNWQFSNRVTFSSEIKQLSIRDRQAIRRLVLEDDYIRHPKEKLTRYHVKFHTQSQKDSQTALTGSLHTNQSAEPIGVISVVKDNTSWRFLAFVTSE